MKHTDEKCTWSVYVHKCPDGMVYVGTTSMFPCRRYKGGKGYINNVEFYEAIQKWGWENITHDVVMQCSDENMAKRLETELIAATMPDKSFNTQVVGCGEFRFSSTMIMDALGKSANTELLNVGYTTNLSNCNVDENPKQQKQSNMKVKETTKEKARVAKFKVIKGVRIETVLDTRYMHNCGGYPVCIRLYKDRKYKYFQTEYVMTVSEFADMQHQDEEHLNKMFDYYCQKVREGGEVITSSDIKSIPEYTQTTTASVGGMVDELFAEKMSLCNAVGTAIGYKDTLKKINEAFPNGLKLTDISVQSVSDFKDYMHTHGMSDTSINFHLTKLKACINYGIYKGYIKATQYPFKRTAVEIDKVTLPKSQKRDTEYITIDDMKRIWDWFMTSKKVNRYVGYFLFSYLHGGINIADMMFLKFDDFYFRERGFIYQRKKTAHKNSFKVFVPATDLTDALFERMGITPEYGKTVFPKLQCDGTEEDYMRVKQKTSSLINNALNKLSTELGLGGISMTTARHSFATIASKNRMPWIMVEQAMGHANNTVSGHYIGGFSLDEMRPDFERLL